MFDLYLKGGIWMHPILLASIVAVTLILERGWFFLRISASPYSLFDHLKDHLSRGDIKGARSAAEQIRGPIGAVLKEGLSAPEEEIEIIQESMSIRGEEMLQRANRGIPALALIASISTMLGLLGTVVGMVETFQQVAEMKESVSPALLASGIWTALITTVGGLLVAIPTLIAHHYLKSRVSHLRFQLEHYGSELLLLLKKYRFQEIKEKERVREAVIGLTTPNGR